MTRWNGSRPETDDRHQVGLAWVVVLALCVLLWALVIWGAVQLWGFV